MAGYIWCQESPIEKLEKRSGIRGMLFNRNRKFWYEIKDIYLYWYKHNTSDKSVNELKISKIEDLQRDQE